MRMKTRFTLYEIFVTLSLLFALTFGGAALYVAAHFIIKYW